MGPLATKAILKLSFWAVYSSQIDRYVMGCDSLSETDCKLKDCQQIDDNLSSMKHEAQSAYTSQSKIVNET